MSYEKELFDEVIYDAAGKMSPNDAADLLEWVESLEVSKRKANEYEAKAKAFDEVLEAHADEVIYIIEKYESGEYDA